MKTTKYFSTHTIIETLLKETKEEKKENGTQNIKKIIPKQNQTKKKIYCIFFFLKQLENENVCYLKY